MKLSMEQKGTGYLLLSGALFGTMPLVTKIAYQYGSNGYSAAFGRFFFGSVILFVLAKMIPGLSLKVTGQELKEIIKMSFFYGLMPIFLYCSYDMIGTGLATTLHFTYPVLVIVMLRIFYKQILEKKQIVCAMLCMGGIGCLYTPNGAISLTGVILAAGSGLVYAAYIVLLGKSQAKNLHVFVLSFWISLFSSLEIGIIAVISGNMVIHMPAQGWIAELVLAFFSTVVALVLFQKGAVLCGEVKASLLSTFEPVTGLLVGILIFGEQLFAKEMIGIVCILMATVLSCLKGNIVEKIFDFPLFYDKI